MTRKTFRGTEGMTDVVGGKSSLQRLVGRQGDGREGNKALSAVSEFLRRGRADST